MHKGAHRQIEDQEFERTGTLVSRNHETPKPEIIIGEMSQAREKRP